jgi:hypothetical protein
VLSPKNHQEEWRSLRSELSSTPHQRFAQSDRSQIQDHEISELDSYYASYHSFLRDHIPAQPLHHKIEGIHPERLAFLDRRGFDIGPWNSLARLMAWPAVEWAAKQSQEACHFYNEHARAKTLRNDLWKRFGELKQPFEAAHRALMLNSQEVVDVDLFVVAGHAGPERGRLSAQLMLQAPCSYVITTGSKANYMGEQNFTMTEAYATALTILREGQGQIEAPRILLEQESRITSDHGPYVKRLIEMVSKIRGRAIVIGAVTSSFHSLRYVTGLDKALLGHPAIQEIRPFSHVADVPNAMRVGHILNEYVKTLYQLCYRDLSSDEKRRV